MFAAHNEAFAEVLAATKLLPPARLAELAAEQAATRAPLAEIVFASGEVDRGTLLRHVSDQLGHAFLPELPATFPGDTIASLPAELARRYRVLPLAAAEGSIDLLAADPFDLRVADDLAFALDRTPRVIVADPQQIERRIRQHYGSGVDGGDDVAAWGDAAGLGDLIENDVSERDLEALAGQAPIVRFVSLVLAQAVRDRASDVHFEPFEHSFRIRCRIDGALRELTPPPRALALPVISRLKVLANLNIAERRVPQDGRIRLDLEGRAVDLRVSTLPTQFGESVVLRVLDASATRLEIGELGMPPDVMASVREVVRRPHGIVIVTGPTGSGKTTTLYSALREINSPELKVLTAEDPVEYEIDGIMQLPVNPGIGLSFGAALRAFLRQDPDIILVGEIRDLETAQIAIQAALTGHLVVTTLHTNDAAGAVTRLIDLGVEPFLIAATLEGVLAQRLLRRVCPQCRKSTEVSAESAERWQLPPGTAGRSVFQGEGCAHCDGSGNRGRCGIFEWLPVDDLLRESITARAPAWTIRQHAVAAGMRTLRDDGLRVLFAGDTSVEELNQYT